MKTLTKIAAALPALALISACSTTAPVMPAPPTSEVVTDSTVPAPQENTNPAPTTPESSTSEAAGVAYDRMAPAPYTCTDDSKITAKQSINKQQVMLTATLPKINWSQQPIILNGGVKGETASYVNNSNPEVIYAWHMKGDEGILAMKWADGKEYQVNCQL